MEFWFFMSEENVNVQVLICMQVFAHQLHGSFGSNDILLTSIMKGISTHNSFVILCSVVLPCST
jgi:hypothetical protein